MGNVHEEKWSYMFRKYRNYSLRAASVGEGVEKREVFCWWGG